MPWLRKKTKRPFVNIVKRQRFSVHGGQLLIEALCRRFKIWDDFPEAKLQKPPGVGLSQEVVAQLLFSFAMGLPFSKSGECFRRDPVLLELLGLESATDEATLLAWLKAQTWEGVRTLRDLNIRLVRQIVADGIAANSASAGTQLLRLVDSDLMPRPEPVGEDKRKGKATQEPPGKAEKSAAFLPVILADSVFLVRRTEGSAGQASPPDHSWQTLSVGQFLLEVGWSHEHWEEDVNWLELERLLTDSRELWSATATCFHYKDAPESLQKGAPASQDYRKIIARAGFSMWTVPAHFDTEPSTNPYLRLSLGVKGWEPAVAGDAFANEYRVLPLGDEGTVVAARLKHADKRVECRYLFIPTGQARQRVESIFRLHRSLEEQPKTTDEMLDVLGLRNLPVTDANGKGACIAVATLAFNLIVALRDFVLPPELREWSLDRVIREVLLAPARLSSRQRQRWAWIWFPEDWLQPCQNLLATYFPRPKRGRPRGRRKSGVINTSSKHRRKRGLRSDPSPRVRSDSAVPAHDAADDAGVRDSQSS